MNSPWLQSFVQFIQIFKKKTWTLKEQRSMLNNVPISIVAELQLSDVQKKMYSLKGLYIFLKKARSEELSNLTELEVKSQSFHTKNNNLQILNILRIGNPNVTQLFYSIEGKKNISEKSFQLLFQGWDTKT